MHAPSDAAQATGSHALLVQLPIPQLNFGKQTGNIPLGAACLKMAADASGAGPVRILPESIATYLGDAALLDQIAGRKPDIVGFSVYAWNIERALYMARQLKADYGPRIVFGGPEVTPDNRQLHSTAVDTCVYGEGEEQFAALLNGQRAWDAPLAMACVDTRFEQGHNPYTAGLLEPEIENLVLIETQRGCPHSCGYCYYGKSRRRIGTIDAQQVIAAIAWAQRRSIPEAYLLDPCLNARRDLADLLADIQRINSDGRIKLISEIRAEAVDEILAEHFAAAGFTWFEIGLQSTNPVALKIMSRNADLQAFLHGTRQLKARGIKVGIDLIAGLPGDDPVGFSRSVDFLIENGLADDVQVFPLSVLPGTPFRQNADSLGLVFDPEPPYTIIESPTFSNRDLTAALEEAEDRFDLCLYPFPDLDLSACGNRFVATTGHRVQHADLGSRSVITKVLINTTVPPPDLKGWIRGVAHPYQLIFGPLVRDQAAVSRLIRRFSAANPFTAFEVVFIEPTDLPDVRRLLAASQLHRPHYLDNDLRFLYQQPGNRAMLFTLLSRSDHLYFQGQMRRQVRWWDAGHLPDIADLERLETFDGIFIGDDFDREHIGRWQADMVPQSQDLPQITFADPELQRRWVQATMAEDYWLPY